MPHTQHLAISPRSATAAAVVCPRDQLSMPAEEGIGRDQGVQVTAYPSPEARGLCGGMGAGGFPGNPGGLVVSILQTAGARAPAHQARGRGRRTWRPTERTAGARMVPPGEGNEARGDGRRGVGVSHSTAEAGELSPRDPVEGRGHRQVAPVEGTTANTPRVGPVSTSRQRIAELARQALGMAVAIAWLPGPAGTRRRVAKLSVEEPDAAEPARPDLWGARVSNDPGLPDRGSMALLACLLIPGIKNGLQFL